MEKEAPTQGIPILNANIEESKGVYLENEHYVQKEAHGKELKDALYDIRFNIVPAQSVPYTLDSMIPANKYKFSNTKVLSNEEK